MTAWPRVALGDLGEWFGGGTPSKARSDFWLDGVVPWLSPKDMGLRVLVRTKDHITPSAVAESAVRLVPAGSLAFVVRSGILERLLPIAEVPFDTTLNQDMKALRPRSGVDLRYLRLALESDLDGLLRRTRKSGTTVASLDTLLLMQESVPLPPLDEQRRIVAVLEDHFSRLSAATEYIETADRRLTKLRVATLIAAASPAQVVPLAELLDEPLRNGHSAPASPTGRVRTLTLTAVTTGVFTDKHTKLTAAPASKVERLWLVPGDILVQRSNTAELVGTSALYDGPTNWATFPDLLIRVRVDRTRVEPEYLAAVLASPPARGRFRALAKGLAGSMPKIDQAAIAGTPVPLPCLEQQRTIVGTLRKASEAQARLQAHTKRLRARQSALRRALLTAAFSGRL